MTIDPAIWKYVWLGFLAAITLLFRQLYRRHSKSLRRYRLTRPFGKEWFEKRPPRPVTSRDFDWWTPDEKPTDIAEDQEDRAPEQPRSTP